jgi:formamidopyrimidine-DNA glycosylase
MPELPEVEITRRGLAPLLEGATIERAEQRRADLRVPFPEAFPERLTGRSVLRLSRRAKYLVAELDDGTCLVMHLGMSGSFRVEPPLRPVAVGAAPATQAHGLLSSSGRPKLEAHDHVVLHLGGGRRIVYNDPRRFGLMTLIGKADLNSHPLFRGLGLEPLATELDPQALAARLRGRATPVKAALLDQGVIAGLGNIYACEALWEARLDPWRTAGSLVGRTSQPSRRLKRLVAAVRSVLADAIAAGGSSLRDYVRADGSLGAFQDRFKVYGREVEPCLRRGCRGMVQRTVQSGRSTFFCPECQR